MDVDALSALYDFQLLNQARVAGRDTQAVAILPKDAYRYGYRIYLDSQKALPLKTDMLDDKGSVISQIMFTSIQIDTEMDGNTEGGFDGREYYHWVQREPGKVENEPEAGEWKFAGLPQGYHQALCTNAGKQRGAAGKPLRTDRRSGVTFALH